VTNDNGDAKQLQSDGGRTHVHRRWRQRWTVPPNKNDKVTPSSTDNDVDGGTDKSTMLTSTLLQHSTHDTRHSRTTTSTSDTRGLKSHNPSYV